MRILIVDGTDTLRSLIEQQADMQVVGEATCESDLVQLAKELSPDVVIIDTSTHNLNEIAAIQQMVKQLTGAKVIMVSENPDARVVRVALEAGVSDYLAKDHVTSELIAAVRGVVGGGRYSR